MKFYFAGTASNPKEIMCVQQRFPKINILESIIYIRDWQINWLKQNPDRFLLDSGVFTFLNQKKVTVEDIDKHTNNYIKFINKYDIQHFFEMDADVFIGLKKVEELRSRIEEETGKKPIPVWHKERGIYYFKKMCREYSYVAIGSPLIKENNRKTIISLFPWFVNVAHKYGAKIHLLGCGAPNILISCGGDSADSTGWKIRYPKVYKFTGNNFECVTNKTPKKLLKNAQLYNAYEWAKFAYFLEGLDYEGL